MTIIRGFVEDIRCFGPLVFLIIRESSTLTSICKKSQFVVRDQLLVLESKKLVRESYIQISGILEENQRAKMDSYATTGINCLSLTESIGGASLVKPRSRPHLEFECVEFRRKEYHEILIANAIAKTELRKTLHQLDFVELTTPKLLSGFTEGGADLFKIDSPTPLFLSQSPQLHKQAAINMGIEKVFEIGPIYRAEKFKTPRHLNETICWDTELATESLTQVMSIIKTGIINMSNQLNQRFSYVDSCSEADFKVVSYDQVIEKMELIPEQTLTIEQERKVPSTFGCKYVFITHYPQLQKPFYIKDRQSFDLVCATGELASGGIRENSHSKLVHQLEERNINLNTMGWYVQMFKIGTPVSGGFGLGLDRLISYLLNLSNIKYCKIF